MNTLLSCILILAYLYDLKYILYLMSYNMTSVKLVFPSFHPATHASRVKCSIQALLILDIDIQMVNTSFQALKHTHTCTVI